MPEREIDLNLSATNIPIWDPANPNYDAAAHEARVAYVLERGLTSERARVDLPPGVYGEWVNRNSMDVERMRAMGFTVDKEYAAKRGIHDVADGVPTMGDVLFMTCPQYVKDMIDKVNRTKYQQANDPKRAKEEIQFRMAMKNEAKGLDYDPTPTRDIPSYATGINGKEIGEQIPGLAGKRLDRPQPSSNQIVFKG